MVRAVGRSISMAFGDGCILPPGRFGERDSVNLTKHTGLPVNTCRLLQVSAARPVEAMLTSSVSVVRRR